MLFIVALILISGSLTARLAVFARVPQVIGFLIAGLVLGCSGFNILNADIVAKLSPITAFVLSLICFVIGGALKLKTLKENKKQYLKIIIAGSLMPFVFVTALLLIGGTLIRGFDSQLVATAFLLGCISVTTAPATITVLKENKTKGPLTTFTQNIVALDDIIGPLLYVICAGVIKIFFSNDHSVYDITQIGAIGAAQVSIIAHAILFPALIGVVCGLLLHVLTIKLSNAGLLISCTLGMVFLVSALCYHFKVNAIFPAMIMGFTVANIPTRDLHDKSDRIFILSDQFTPPMFAMFFVLIGAAADVHSVTGSGSIFAALYLIGRSGGKILGITIGAKAGGAPILVQQNLRYCLLNQAGVAMMLSLNAAADFPGIIGSNILFVITACVFVLQLIGPICVKYAVTRAGEINQERWNT
ncbi:hypothetical protein FACS1894102_1880 [Spirochaetia bacterium]|nr:hypothetical protein FACS1894102_1880 [Spirochaetia bacterium]